jgi:hypothetical protein
MYEDLIPTVSEMSIFGEEFTQYFSIIYRDQIKLFKESQVELDEDFSKKPAITSILVWDKFHTVLLLIKVICNIL